VKLAIWAAVAVVALSVIGYSPAAMQQPSASAAPVVASSGDIPPEMLALYVQTANTYGLDWSVLAAIGKVETDHCRSNAVSSAGAVGCMQFMPATWAQYGKGDPNDPAAAIDAAARYLVANGAPMDYHRAIFAYNHAEWYVTKVLDQAKLYSEQAVAGTDVPLDGTAQSIANSPMIAMNPQQVADLLSGGIDPRVIATLQWIAHRHSIVITALRRDHKPGSNHEAGRAFDVGAVDGKLCAPYTPSDPCGQLIAELAAVSGPMRSTELIACWDPDGADPRGFARSDHCDHFHVGWDG
jgi:hypothetical protein